MSKKLSLQDIEIESFVTGYVTNQLAVTNPESPVYGSPATAAVPENTYCSAQDCKCNGNTDIAICRPSLGQSCTCPPATMVNDTCGATCRTCGQTCNLKFCDIDPVTGGRTCTCPPATMVDNTCQYTCGNTCNVKYCVIDPVTGGRTCTCPPATIENTCQGYTCCNTCGPTICPNTCQQTCNPAICPTGTITS